MRVPRREPDAHYTSSSGGLVEFWFEELVCTITDLDNITIGELSRCDDKLIVFFFHHEENSKRLYERIHVANNVVVQKWMEHLSNKEINRILES